MKTKSLRFALSLIALSTLLLCGDLKAQFKTELLNDEGATAPCIGVGYTGVVKKCAEMFEEAGFIRADQIGITGLTLGTAGKDDGIILQIGPAGPAAQAGLQVGDAIIAVENKPVQPTPGTIAEHLTFGPRNSELHMQVLRGGATVDVHLIRAAANAPDGPKSPGRLYLYRPLIDWRGQFVPCMGLGPAAPAAIAFCDEHFKPFGFIKVGDFGTTGFHLDRENPDSATIISVDPGSPAASAGITVGDKIISVEGKPLTASLGVSANQLLFGKTGVVMHLTVRRGQGTQAVALTLADTTKK